MPYITASVPRQMNSRGPNVVQFLSPIPAKHGQSGWVSVSLDHVLSGLMHIQVRSAGAGIPVPQH